MILCSYFGIHMYTDRMPVFIGSFLSRSVYGGQLKSHHSIAGHDCLAFVNEASGIEIKTGFSWTVSPFTVTAFLLID